MSAASRSSVFVAIDWCLRALGALMLLTIALGLIDSRRFRDLTPPDTVVDLRSFHAWRSDLTEAKRIEFRGSVYYSIIGPYAYSLPSNKSEYYFDANGNFLHHNRDPGDIKSPRPFFSPNTKISPMTVDEILEATAVSDLPSP